MSGAENILLALSDKELICQMRKESYADKLEAEHIEDFVLRQRSIYIIWLGVTLP